MLIKKTLEPLEEVERDFSCLSLNKSLRFLEPTDTRFFQAHAQVVWTLAVNLASQSYNNPVRGNHHWIGW